MEEEQNWINVRYSFSDEGTDRENSKTEYVIRNFKLLALTVVYTRTGREREKTQRIEIDFDPLYYYDSVYVVAIKYNLCHNGHTQENPMISVKGMVKYIAVTQNREDAESYINKVNKNNIKSYLDNKDYAGCIPQLDEVYIEPTIISYEKH